MQNQYKKKKKKVYKLVKWSASYQNLLLLIPNLFLWNVYFLN